MKFLPLQNCFSGTSDWVNRLQWKNSSQWKTQMQKSFAVEGYIEGFQKSIGNLQYYTVLRSGHMVNIQITMMNPISHKFRSQ